MSTCLATLLPPNYHVRIGRPKKKTKRSKLEDESFVKDGKVSGNNAEANGIAFGQAEQVELVVGQDGLGVVQVPNAYGSDVGVVIGLSVVGGQPGYASVGVGSRSSSPMQVTKPRNAHGRQMGDGLPTQSSAAADA
ncbi:hypothetical protein Tco_1510321, partial [Tanacetum coccineum]